MSTIAPSVTMWLRFAETRRLAESRGADPAGGAPDEFAALIRRESEDYAKVVKSSGAKVD